MLQKLLGLETASSAYSFLSERGILSGFYVGALMFGGVIGNTLTPIAPDAYLWLGIACFIFGLIIANTVYEVVMPLLRSITDPVLVLNFHNAVKLDSRRLFPSYSSVRKFRETFMASDGPAHLKAKILEDESLRLTLTYLTSAAVFGFLLIGGYYVFPVSQWIIKLEVAINTFIFLTTLVARFPRAASLGTDIGMAYLYTLEHPAAEQSATPGRNGKATKAEVSKS